MGPLSASTDVKMNENISGADAGGQTRGEDRDIKARTGSHVEERKDRQRSPSPELEPAIVPRSPQSSINCPICQVPFPVNEIELHAAYCDGEVAVVDERGPDGDRVQGDGLFIIIVTLLHNWRLLHCLWFAFKNKK